MTKINLQKTMVAFVFALFAVVYAGSSFAGVYSLGSNTGGASATETKSCWQQGYRLTSCTGGKELSEPCTDPSNGKVYYKNCACPSTFTKTCTGDYKGSGTGCDGKFEACVCNPDTFTFDSSNCKDGKVPAGGSCTGDDGSVKFRSCSCPSNYKECSAPLVGNGTACVDNGVSKYASCSCSSEYNATCPDGVNNGASSCTEPSGTVKYKTADCKTAPAEPEAAACLYEHEHYWNSDGAHSIPTSDTYSNPYNRMITRAGGPCRFAGYGANSIITIPAGKTYDAAHFEFWQGGTVKGELIVLTRVKFGGWTAKKGSAAYNWTFNDKATINGVIQIRTDTNDLGTVNFAKGLYGNHHCEWISYRSSDNSWPVSKSGSCPSDWYKNNTDVDPCPYEYRHYWNRDGAYTMPTSNSYVNSYGRTVTQSGGPCAFEGYGANSAIKLPLGKTYVNVILRFTSGGTVDGPLNVSRYLRFESRSGKYNWVFNDKATVNGRIVIDEPHYGKVEFKKGLYGNHTCEWAKDTGGWNWVTVNTRTGCPTEWYANGGK